MYLRFMQNHHQPCTKKQDYLRRFREESLTLQDEAATITTTTTNIRTTTNISHNGHQIYISYKLRRLIKNRKNVSNPRKTFSFFFFWLLFSSSFFFLPLLVFSTNKMHGDCFHYSLCFTRLPLMSLPSRIASFPCLHSMTECSLIRATYSKSSVRTEGQLSFKYSKPSVCITAEKKHLEDAPVD